MKRLLFLGVVALLLSIKPAGAAVTANSVVTAQIPNRISYQFGATASCTASGNPYPCCTGSAAGCVAGTNYPIYTAGTNGSKCTAVWMNNNDTATHAITFQLLSSTVTTKGPGTIVTTTASGVSGTFTVPQAINSATNWPGLAPDSDSNPTISLNSGDTLNAQFATAITSGDVVNFSGTCYDY